MLCACLLVVLKTQQGRHVVYRHNIPPKHQGGVDVCFILYESSPPRLVYNLLKLEALEGCATLWPDMDHGRMICFLSLAGVGFDIRMYDPTHVRSQRLARKNVRDGGATPDASTKKTLRRFFTFY